MNVPNCKNVQLSNFRYKFETNGNRLVGCH